MSRSAPFRGLILSNDLVPHSSQTPVRVKHWFTLSIFFSVWDEDIRGQPLNRQQHGQLREGKLKMKTAITHVSPGASRNAV